MASLVRDVRANTIAIMAMALIPLAGMVGGGVDISRMYIVKTRLQHACDAGALAGRKAMGGGVWSQNNYAARTAAEKFFDANIQAEPYGASSLTRSFSESSGRVTGTASANLPMTLMKIFGRSVETLTVACDAEMQLPNTDIMFVLDVTGSMASKAVYSDPDTKIESLRKAVKCFYEVVARYDTSANCDGGNTSGGTGNQVQIRFGFVPYATNVNVGKLLSPDWFANSWKYQSREPLYSSSGGGTWVQSGSPAVQTENVTYNNVPYYYCNDSTASTLNTHDEQVNGNSKQVTDVTYDANSWSSSNGGTCYGTKKTTKTTYTYQSTSGTFSQWHYGQITQNISGLKNGSSWRSSFQLPIGYNGANQSISWDGCIEEASTVKQSSYSPIPSAAKDLNIDLIPSQSDPSTLWGPALPDLIYTRQATYSSTSSTSGWNTADAYTTTTYKNNSYYACPTPSTLLEVWNSPSVFENYVNSLSPEGNTYHDIGLLWGARLMSPDGIFAARNTNKEDIARHLIFMTDGDTNAVNTDYAAYGVPWFDRRQTSSSSVPSNNSLNDQVNARFLALCTAVKNKNITLWVISFGDGSNSSTEDRLEQCASDGHYYSARDGVALQQTFSAIAGQISQLRLTR